MSYGHDALERHQHEERVKREQFVRQLRFWIPLGTAFLVFLVAGGCWGLPHYSVWQQGLAGEAELKRASQNRQIAIQEAEAKLASAGKLAEAGVERAKGVAAANKIIGESLKDNEAYLRWLWIDALNNPNKGQEIIYIPTEAGLPLLEAGKRK